MKFSSEAHKNIINPLALPGEEFSVFTYLYLSAGAPAQGEAKGLRPKNKFLYN